jgi:hypothetical protein
MLVVTVSLVPGGVVEMKRPIALMRISNLSELAELSDYRIEAMEAPNPLTGARARNAECLIRGHQRAQPVWALLARATDEIMKADFVEH